MDKLDKPSRWLETYEFGHEAQNRAANVVCNMVLQLQAQALQVLIDNNIDEIMQNIFRAIAESDNFDEIYELKQKLEFLKDREGLERKRDNLVFGINDVADC